MQDRATAAAVEFVGVSPGEKVLDACAAPGGKTVQLLWRGADLTACEVNAVRRRRLDENLARTRLKARVVGSLAEIPACDVFDAVLVAAP